MDSPAPARPRRRWAIVLAWAAAFVLFLSVPFWLLYLHDEPPLDDADLRTPPPIVPDKTNGFRAIGQIDNKNLDFIGFAATQGIDEDEANKIMRGDASNDTLVADFLAKAQPALAQIDAALAMPSFEFSQPVKISTMIPEVARLIAGSKALALAASDAKARGDYGAALREISQLHLLAKRTAAAHGGLIVALTAIAEEGIFLNQALHLANDPGTPSSAITALSQILSDEIPWPEAMRFSFKTEYQFTRVLLFTLREHPEQFPGISHQDSFLIQLPFLSYFLKINQTLRETADFDRAAIQAIGLDYGAAEKKIEAASPKAVASAWTFLQPNGIGHFLLGILLPTLNGVLPTEYKIIAGDRMAQTAFALRRYFDGHHALPAKLDDLVPQYLAAVPTDPFDGKPLRYDAAKGMVYSVGTLLKDNGGSKFLKMSKDDSNYEDPFTDSEQPTLQLTFQNPPKAATPVNAAAN